MKNLKKAGASIFSLFLCLCVLAGCVIYQWAEVTSGLYTSEGSVINGSPDMGTAGIDAVFVDRDHQTAWVMFDDATLRIMPFIARPRETWPTGCPSNLESTYMETLNLDVAQIEIASATLQGPVLVRDCPPDPVELVLREDGDIGGGGAACVGAQTCFIFTWASSTLALPQSMKSYELYSWTTTENNDWSYTLTTGTNRTKTWEEISGPESIFTRASAEAPEPWVKISVQGTATLKSVLDRLPKGESVIWIGTGDPSATSTVQEHISRPGEATLHEIQTYAEKIGVNLTISE